MDPGSDLDFASFYARHAPLVRRMLARGGVRNADLDDVLQETFVTVHRLLPEFEGRSSLQTWLHAIVWRVAHADAAFSWLAPYGSTPAPRIAEHLAAMRAQLAPRCPDKRDRSSS